MTHNKACTSCQAALPWYVAGTLSVAEQAHLHHHLANCIACQQELAQWQAIATEAQQHYVQPLHSSATGWERLRLRLAQQQATGRVDKEVQPPISVLQLLGRETRPRQQPVWQRTLKSGGVYAWHLSSVLLWQLRVIHRSVWLTTLLAMFLGFCIVFFNLYLYHNYDHTIVRGMLVVMTLGASAIGAALIAGKENDSGLEISLSTATSGRVIVFCRLVLVVSYNTILATFVSALLAQASADGLWGIIQLWLGPLFLFTSLSLLLSVMVSSAFAVLSLLLLDFGQVIRLNFESQQRILSLVTPGTWQTSPVIFLLAGCCLVLCMLYIPRQTRGL